MNWNKTSVHQECLHEVKRRLDEVGASIQRVQESIENEEGSTAGNKYETARAMSQLEMERLKKQEAQLLNLHKAIQRLDPRVKHRNVQVGSLLKLNDWNCYLAGPLGLLKLNGESIRVISLASPLGQLLQNKSKGEQISFQGQTMTIRELE